jgi:hypothetical protein
MKIEPIFIQKKLPFSSTERTNKNIRVFERNIRIESSSFGSFLSHRHTPQTYSLFCASGCNDGHVLKTKASASTSRYGGSYESCDSACIFFFLISITKS